MQFLINNKSKGICWKAFENPPHCPNISIIGMLDYACAVRAASKEAHLDAFEIHYVSKGFQMFLTDRSFVSLHAGNILVTLPGQTHGTANGILNPSIIYWARIPVNLSVDFPPETASVITKHLRKISGQACIETTPILFNLMSGLLALLETDPSAPANQIALKNYSLALISSLPNIIPLKNSNDRRAVMIEKVCRIIKKINDEPELPYNIPSMSQECGIGETLFRRLFEETSGFAPVDYIHFTRTEIAKKLLIKGVSVTETAYKLGYSSSPHFCRTFSRWTGVAPSAYLNQTAGLSKTITRSSEKMIYQRLHRIYGSS